MKKYNPMIILIIVTLTIAPLIFMNYVLVYNSDKGNNGQLHYYYKSVNIAEVNSAIPVDSQWSKTGWSSFNIPGKPKVNSNNYVWIKISIQGEPIKNAALMLKAYDQIFQVYMDKNVIYSYGSFNKSTLNNTIGSPTHFIDLPNDYSGKDLYIKMYSSEKANIGYIRSISIDDKNKLVINMIKTNLMQAILAFIFIVIGLCSIPLGFIRKSYKPICINFSAACIITGIWLLSDGEIKQIFTSNYTLCKYISGTAFYILPAIYYNLIKHILNNRFSKYLFIMAKSHVIFVLAAFTMDFLRVSSIILVQPIFFILFGINMLLLIYILIESYREGNQATKLISLSFFLMCSFAVEDLINWNLNVKHIPIYFSQWGIFIFIITLIILMLRDMLNNEMRAYEYSQKLKEAKVNDRLKAEFFSNISHELRTPINVILSTVQLLNLFSRDGSLKSENRDIDKYLGIMKQNSYRLIRLVNNIIDITQIDSGYLKLSMAKHNIVEIVENITQDAVQYIKDKNISITFDTDVEEKIISCDSEAIDRIMLNLLSNAVKFSKPNGKIIVSVCDRESFVDIIIHDDGIGIETDKQNIIFERFAKVDKSLTRNNEGSGIGLSIVKSLVEMHGGRIALESEYDVGTTFTISLPANKKITYKEIAMKEISTAHEEKIDIEFSDIYNN
ncbi:hypothetical protein IAI10_10980 [Clostridium sp. 19966]|uniref:sensor histidine kinase n=1 Tax=Clostridium sp. 19966 TaxID=2768166 RepID=UPI0028DEB274|nr:ATP-binding protein [Clostridium sp. 19966]MDT8717180.1 hypothetical protein [Clostridium sp. 19966]